jgi:hypothetical protein
MLVAEKAAKTQIVVFTVLATDEITLVGFCRSLASDINANEIKGHTTTTSIAHRLVFTLKISVEAIQWSGWHWSWLWDRLGDVDHRLSDHFTLDLDGSIDLG